MGVNSETTLSEWLYPTQNSSNTDPIDGQVRILAHPDAMVNPSCARIFHYSANWEFFGGRVEDAGSRAAFVQDLRKILGPVMSSQAVKKRVTEKKFVNLSKEPTTKTKAASTPAPVSAPAG